MFGGNHDNDWQALYPFASHWFNRAGGRMHYVDEGQHEGVNEALLFVHGNPTWSFHWRRLIAALRVRYRCVAPDHLGCGLSDKPARFLRLADHIDNLAALVDELRLDRITLVAQDWGGAIGLGAMLRMPERLHRIVLFNTGAFPPRYIPWRIAACRLPVVGRLAVQGGNLFSRAALRMTLARQKALDAAVAAGYLAPYDSWSSRRAVYGFVLDIPTPRSGVSPSLETASRGDAATWRLLAEIELALPTFADRPACLIWGMRDWCFRSDCLNRFIEAWPRGEVQRLADAGHWVVEDAPEDALRIVTAFLERGRETAAQERIRAAGSAMEVESQKHVGKL
jgi:haloalkane dehalogenase